MKEDPAPQPYPQLVPTSADIGIVGGGIIGTNLAYFLTKANPKQKVVLIERSRQLATESTGHSASCFRQQFTREFNVKLCRLSRMLYLEELSVLIGFNPLVDAGYLWLRSKEGFERAARFAAMQREWGVPVDVLSPEEVQERFPFVKTSELGGATFGREDGFIKSPAEISKAAAEAAQERGLVVLTNTELLGIETIGGRIAGVKTNRGTIRLERLVNAAGAWSGRVAAMAGANLPVVPVPRQLSYAEPVAEIIMDTCPMVIVPGGAYMRPKELKLLIGYAPKDTPSSFSAVYDDEVARQAMEDLARFLPALNESGFHRADCGLYEVSADKNGLIGPDIEVGGLYHCAGFSGHGIMQGPGAAKLMSEILLSGHVESLSPEIFQGLSTDRLRTGDFKEEMEVI